MPHMCSVSLNLGIFSPVGNYFFVDYFGTNLTKVLFFLIFNFIFSSTIACTGSVALTIFYWN